MSCNHVWGKEASYPVYDGLKSCFVCILCGHSDKYLGQRVTKEDAINSVIKYNASAVYRSTDSESVLIDELRNFISHITHEATSTDNEAARDHLVFIANELNRIIDEARS